MRVLLVTNPASGSSDEETLERVRISLDTLGEVTPFVASSPETFAGELRSAAKGADRVIVAGGDGTFGRSVDALAHRHDELEFSLVPMGTGNDLARTLSLVEDPIAMAAWLSSGRTIEIDLGRVTWADGERCFVNACVGGFSVDVDEALEEETKRRLGRFAFWVGGMRAARDITRYRVIVNDRAFEDVVVVGIGNGRTVAGGLELWPDARPNDGLLDACVISAPDIAAGVKAAARVKLGSHQALEGVTTMRSSTVTVEADPTLALNVDGELVGLSTPATFGIAGKIRLNVPAKALAET